MQRRVHAFYRNVPARILSLLLPVLLLTACQPKPMDMVFFNGQVLTLDERNTIARAVAIRDGRIVAVGGFCDVLPYLFNPDVRRVNLAGKTLVPGFVDAHSHFPGTGLYEIVANLNSPPMGPVETLSQILDALRNLQDSFGKERWIVGYGYDDTLLAERRHPTRDDLDVVSEERPVWIMHSSGHFGVANSRLLSLVGIDEDTPDPEGGVIRRYPGTNIPNGVLEEHAMDLVLDVLPVFSVPQILRVVEGANSEYAGKGITTAQNGLAERLYIDALSILSRLDILPVRLVMWPDAELGREIVEGTYDVSGMETERFTVGAMKLVADGSIQAYSGFLSEPYHVIPPDKPDGYRGYPRISQGELIEQMTYFHQAGYQVAVHGNGDAAIDYILNAFEEAQNIYPREDARPIVIHSQMARDDQLDRMKSLGMIPSFFSLHTYYWGDRHMEIFMGPERAKRMSPAGSAVERGMRFTIHTDSPVVPMDPMLLMWAAVNRLAYDTNTPIYSEDPAEDQRISPLQALRAVTIDAAWQLHLEDTRGSIEKGKFADLVILSENPLEDPEGIKDIQVLETIMGGRTVYSADSR